MELLPIIYWSLLTVGVLAVIVIIVSFFTFQFRKKFGNIPSVEVKGTEREKKVKITNPDKKKKTEKKHHPKVQTRSRQKSSSTSSSKKRSKTEEEIALYKKPTRETKKKRVEILNPGLQKNSSISKSLNDNKYHPMGFESKHRDWN